MAHIKFIYLKLEVLCGRVVSVLDCQSRGVGFKFPTGQKFGSRFMLHLRPDSSQLSYYGYSGLHRWWEDETAREWTGHLLSYAGVRNEVINAFIKLNLL